ncbi:hypothetical protein H2201_000606 [Coniosporium apollinis]|uniref:RBR-type E3 ubiquitin transferase n=1 Tax=Coniosporium apollinis TaxID=61459 RepID=A0ABQ9P3S5_9PEZI|nr:hypothetical protein H2201_000606 [Coniosporium apollinis]
MFAKLLIVPAAKSDELFKIRIDRLLSQNLQRTTQHPSSSLGTEVEEQNQAVIEQVVAEVVAPAVEEESEERCTEKREEKSGAKVEEPLEVTVEELPKEKSVELPKEKIKELPETKLEDTTEEETIERVAEHGIKKKLDQKITDKSDEKSDERSPASTCYACVACADLKPYMDCLVLRCQPEPHVYCLDCVVNLFKASISDTSLFPPRCCREPISIESARPFLAEDSIRTFEEKSLELSTPNPIYCCRPECSHFIPPSRIREDKASCPTCGIRTCTHCKKRAHKGFCSKDPSVEELLGVAKDRHWQRCYNCHAMVELTVSCNHITYVS